VLDQGATLLLRWNPNVLPVCGSKGEPFPLLEQLRKLPPQVPKEWQVRFEHNGRTYPLRLCAVRKSQVATERARRKVLRKAQLNQTQAQPKSLELAAYVLVLTNLPPEFSARRVLGLYRGRWQVELAFKRLKSLLGAGHVPKTDDQSAGAWMQGKILTALLLERLLLEARIFSPWGFELSDFEPVAGDPGSA
jgi:hypothetical protein